MKVDLEEKIAVVTGGGGFIGSSICKELAKNGAVVVVQDINLNAAQAIAHEITSAGYKADYIGGDLTNPVEVEKLIDQIIEKYGRIDILVNNAGINTGSKDRVNIDEYNNEVWNGIISVDLYGTYYCSKYVSKHMVKQRSGRIINISSVAGVVALRLQCAFVAAKSGLLGLTRAMAAELGQHGILVNAIAPGSIVNAAWVSEKNESLVSHIPLKRQGYAEEVAAAVVFFAAPEASYITGAMLTVDGGWTCGFMRDW